MSVVVVVDDDQDVRELLSVVLRKEGHRVHTAPTGASGLASVRRYRPDLVILDHQMPGLTGLEIARALRSDPETAHVPLLMISASLPVGAADVCDEVAQKPVRPRVVNALVDSMLLGARDGGAGAGSDAPLTGVSRLQAVAAYDWDDPVLRAAVNEVSRRSAERLGLPIGLTTLVLNTAQVLAGSHGVTGWIAEADGTPVEWSFCAQVVRTGLPYVVPDTVRDPVQGRNPLVTVDGFGAYAGVPLVTSQGYVLGAHCVLGMSANDFTPAQLAELRSAADEIMALAERFRLPGDGGTAVGVA